jgi:hypothetical protein
MFEKLKSKLESLKKRATIDYYDGFILELNQSSWSKIDKKARNEIRRAKKNGIEIIESNDMLQFIKICRGEKYLPTKKQLEEYQRLFLGIKNGEVIGGIIIEMCPPIIRYKYAASTELGYKLQVNSLLLWHIVELFHDSEYKFFVLGSSSIASIQHFKEQFATMRVLIPTKFWDFVDKKLKYKVYVIFEKEPEM